jgi:FkbM family methyltransferase
MAASNLRRILRDCLTDRQPHLRLRAWMFRRYDRALNNWPRAPLPFRKSVCEIHPRNLAAPFFLRLGSTDWWVFDEIFLGSEYDAVLQHDIGSPRLVVDLGSNIGLSVRVWRENYPAARIIAVEPDADNARVLRMNVPETGGAKVALEQACILGRARPVRLRAGDGEWAYSVEEAGDGATGTIASLTMPELLARYAANASVDLLKCDIEGAEVELFRYCAEWLPRVRFAIVELHGDYRRENLESDLRDAGVPVEMLWTDEGDNLDLVFFKTGAAAAMGGS